MWSPVSSPSIGIQESTTLIPPYISYERYHQIRRIYDTCDLTRLYLQLTNAIQDTKNLFLPVVYQSHRTKYSQTIYEAAHPNE
jgi:hypothetical protein